MKVEKIFTCEYCGIGFHSKKACATRTPKYCSMNCYLAAVSKYAGIVFICECCGKEFKTDSAYIGHIPKYCSRHCCGQAARGRTAWNSGQTLSDKHREALSEGRKVSLKCKGYNLYNWKGGESTFVERTKIYQNNRRARFLGGGKLDTAFLHHLLIAHKGLCFYCEQPLEDYHCLEHLTPLSRGGKNQQYNLVYSCKSCNSTKRQKTLEDFAIETGRIWLLDKWEDIFIYTYGHTQEARCNTAN